MRFDHYANLAAVLAADLVNAAAVPDPEARSRALVEVASSIGQGFVASPGLADDLAARASSTIVATKAMLLRLRDHRRPPAGGADDLLRACYGSDDFKEGVAAFLDGRPPRF